MPYHDTPQDFMPLGLRIADSLPAMIAYWDKDLVCRLANTAYLGRLCKTREEIVGMRMTELFPAHEQYKPHIAGALDGIVQHFEQTIPTADSYGICCEQVSFYPDTDNNTVKGFIMHVTDITHQKVQKQQAEESGNIISNQNKNLLSFANIVSHNLRSYANNLEVMLEMYESEGDTAEREKIFNFLKELSAGFKSSVEKLTGIVKVQNLGKVLTEQVNLYSYAIKAADVLHTQLEATKATIHNNINPEINIEANPAYVESIVLNFIDNAIKYRHPDRAPVIELSTMEVGNETVLNIKDNGIGIDLDTNRHKLYGMYSTFHGNKDATGLGLFMTKHQVDSMGGYIGVESGVGTGTWFRVYFKTKGIA